MTSTTLAANMPGMPPPTTVNGSDPAVIVAGFPALPQQPGGVLSPHPAGPNPEPRPAADLDEVSSALRFAMALLILVAGVLISVVVVSPIALSSGELVRWAGSQDGLGLTGWWPWLVFISLDCAAGTCVLLSVYCAMRGESPGVFGILVWVFAGFSAFANYRHGSAPGAPGDAWWFFPVMSVMGPGLLEAVTRFIRSRLQKNSGKRASALPKFGLIRWLPIVGAPRDTYGARRTAQLLNIRTVNEAVERYHTLCPDGSMKVAKAIRAWDVAAADRAAKEAAKAAAREQKEQALQGRRRQVTADVDRSRPHNPNRDREVIKSPTKTGKSAEENWVLIREQLEINPGVSKTELANVLGISRTRVGQIVDQFAPKTN